MAHQDDIWTAAVHVAPLTDVGMRRANNQDGHRVVMASDPANWQQRGHLFIVADGMGAHAAGELASKMAVDNIPHTYHKLLDISPPEAMGRAIIAANQTIYERGQENSDFQGMGTTCSALALLPQGALIGHVGDSRIYRVRDDVFEQLTADHSLVWEMAAAGQFSDDDVPDFVPKNVITRSLGPNPHVQPDLEGPIPVAPGDLFVLCSDGLTGPVEDHEIGVIVNALPPEDAAQTLVDLANLRGGPDNITVIIVRVDDPMMNGAMASNTPDLAADSGGTIHPGVWVALGFFVLLGVVSAALDMGMEMVGASVFGCLVASVIALIQKSNLGGGRSSSFPGGPFGKAPYRTYPCKPDEEMVASLTDTVSRLREAAKSKSWQINWPQFSRLEQAAHEARDNAQFPQAVMHCSEAIRFMLGELRGLQSSSRNAPVDPEKMI